MRHKIFLVSPATEDAYVAALRTAPDLELTAGARTFLEALFLAVPAAPDLIVVDLPRASTLELIRQLPRWERAGRGSPSWHHE